MKFIRFDYQGRTRFGVLEAQGMVRVYEGDMFAGAETSGDLQRHRRRGRQPGDQVMLDRCACPRPVQIDHVHPARAGLGKARQSVSRA